MRAWLGCLLLSLMAMLPGCVRFETGVEDGDADSPAGTEEPDPFDYYVEVNRADITVWPDGSVTSSVALGGGTCVHATDDGCMILTVAHVCEADLSPPGTIHMYAVERLDGTISGAVVVAVDHTVDLCLLRAMGTFEHPVSEIVMPEAVEPLAEVINVGAPGMTFGSGERWGLQVRPGTWSGWYDCNILHIPTLQFTTPVTYGQSGSPVLHEGRLFSVIYRLDHNVSSMGVGVPPDRIVRFLRGAGVEMAIVR